MKSLVNGCAAAALLMGLAFQVHAEIAVREAPIHAVPADDDDTGPAVTPDTTAQTQIAPVQAAPIQVAQAEPAPIKAEPAVIKALLQPKAPPPAPALTPDENAFFAAFGGRVTDAASAYESYVRRVTAIDPAFSGAAAVQHAVKASAAYHAGQLREGMIAYAALIALRNPDFVDGVRAIQNPNFADDLAVHPEAVMQVRGAGSAAADAAGVLQAQGAAMMAEGKAITRAAYDIQAQAWSKSPVADPQAVLAGAKESSGELRAATTPSKEKLLASLVGTPQGAPAGAAPAPDVVRGVALAAMAILGRTGDGADARYEALLRDASSEDCLKMAKLNLAQCLAVAGAIDVLIVRAGRHAVADTGKCIADASAGGGPADAAPAPRLQQADLIGPEQAAAYGKTATLADDDDDVAQPVPPAPALAATPAPTPAPRQYAEAPAPAPVAPQAALQPPPQAALQYAEPQRAEAMPDPRAPQQQAAQAYAPPPQQPAYGYAQNPYPQNQYAQNNYAPPPAPQAPPAQYARTYAQQPYQQPYQPAPPQAQYAPQQAYQQPAYPAQQPYQQPPAYAPNYGGQPYPQTQGYPAYQGGYSGR